MATKYNKVYVFKGFLAPKDEQQKTSRRAVVLEKDGDWFLVAPAATTAFEKVKIIPRGYVLFTNKSPIYNQSGFDKENILIGLRDAAWFRIGSKYIKNLEHIGELDLNKDERFKLTFNQVASEVDFTLARKW